MKGRELPHDIEAEKSVLGACFLSKYALEKTCESLSSDDFYLQKNAIIFQIFSSLSESKTPVDMTTVTSTLTQKNQLNDAGGVEYLTELINYVPTAANVDYYISIVLDRSILRKVINEAEQIATLGYQSSGSVDDLLEEANKRILNISKRKESGEFRSIKEVLYKTQADLERLSKTRGEITGIPSGWIDLDKVTAGFHENELIIIAARPAMGKTAIALNMATYVAMNTDKTVALFNLEMGAEQLATRMLSSLGQIDGYKLRTGSLLNDDWKRINESISRLSQANMYIDDTPGISIGEIRAKCRRLSASEQGLGMVIIDYLQLISGGRNYGANRQQEVSDISRSLKTMAMELHVPVIALAQLSRAVEGREDKRPIMSDLRESGSIEQDADIVSFLYRDDYYNKEARMDDNTSITEFIIGKHRNGPTKTVQLLYKRDTSTFLNFQKDDDKEVG